MTILQTERLMEITRVTGTGPITLEGAPESYERFRDHFKDGFWVAYKIEQMAGDYEAGIGWLQYGDPDTIQRSEENVVLSSNGNGLVSFPAGEKQVMSDFPVATGAAMGPLGTGIETITQSETLRNNSAGLILVDASVAPVSLVLPALEDVPQSWSRRFMRINPGITPKDSSNLVTIEAIGQQRLMWDDAFDLLTQYATVTIQKHNGEWWVTDSSRILIRALFTVSNMSQTRWRGLKFIRVEVVGGGGAGGGCPATSGNTEASSGGGGGGGAAIATIDVSVAETLNIQIGDGGVPGLAADGGPGQDSSISGVGFPTVTGEGGGGGAAGIPTSGEGAVAGGAGGSGMGGEFIEVGGDGGPGYVFGSNSQATGEGGGSRSARRRVFSVVNPGLDGFDGNLYGGGGTGTIMDKSQAANTGGAGAQGAVILEY